MQRERLQVARSAPPPDFNALPIGAVIPALIKRWGLERRFQEEALQRDWVDIVGPVLARHARPGRLDRGILHIYVDHPAWLMELRPLEPDVLRKVQERYGADRIRQTRWAVDPGGRSSGSS